MIYHTWKTDEYNDIKFVLEVITIYPYWYSTPYYRNIKNQPKDPVKPIAEKHCGDFQIGDLAPQFALDAVVNGNRVKVSLPDYSDKWVVLFFYSSDFTFV